MTPGRTLVLCIDRDDDIGYKGGIESPVVGRAACLDAANRLGLKDPEDSDVNAIFSAIKIFDELQERGEDAAISILAGSHTNLDEGDHRIASGLTTVIKNTGVDSCILVTDGAEDEYVLPIIQSRIAISSIQRVVVSQIPNLEGTYYIIKKLLDDPKVSKTIFVPLGLGMLLYALAYLFGYPEAATVVVVGVIGIYFLFKGLGIDEVFGYFFTALQISLQKGKFTFVSYIAAILLVIIGLIMGLTSLLVYYKASGIFFHLLTFIYGAVGWLTLAGLVAVVGKIVDGYLTERQTLGRVIVLPFFIAALGAITYGASVYILSISDISQFAIQPDTGVGYIVFTTICGLICAFFGVYLQSVITKWLGVKYGAAAEGGG